MQQRSTTLRNRHRRIIARDKPPCHVCGGEILYDVEDHLHPLAFTIDHIIPLARGGRDRIDNLAACHRRCNQSKYTSLPQPPPPDPGLPPGVTFITHRNWSPSAKKTPPSNPPDRH